MTAARASCKPGGVIILCANARTGTEARGFTARCGTAAARKSFTPSFWPLHRTKNPDQWESQILSRILMKHQVIFVSRPEMKPIIEDMKMTYAASLDAAMSVARNRGKNSVTVIPNGISVIVRG
jgi:nickel-dependent lactate racemase